MHEAWRVEAVWDGEAGVWTSISNVPGLVIETATLGEFEALMRELVPGLLADNLGETRPVRVEWASRGAFDLVAA